MANKYWVGGAGTADWDDSGPTPWSDTSGGANDASAPISTDDVFFDANSGTGTCTRNSDHQVKTLDCTGYSGTIDSTGCDLTINGNLFKLSSTMGWSMGGSCLFSFTSTSGTCLITSAGQSFTKAVLFNGVGGTFQLQDNFQTSSQGMTLTNGTFDANGFNVSTVSFSSSNSNVRTITMGSGTWTFNTTGTVWNLATTTNLTFNANTSTIVINNVTSTSKTFQGGGLTYSTLTCSGDNITIVGNNTFNTLNVNNAGLSNGLKITSGSTQTITYSFKTNGSAGNLAKLLSTSAGSSATLTKTVGTISVDYMSIKDSTATGGATWYAGNNSTDVSGNSGWLFRGPALACGSYWFSGIRVLEPLDASVACLSWYDSADTATITLTGSSVDQLNDKSGNGNHVSQGTAGNKPTLTTLSGRQVIEFDGAGDLLEKTSPSGLEGITAFSLYLVCRFTDSGAGEVIVRRADAGGSIWQVQSRAATTIPPVARRIGYNTTSGPFFSESTINQTYLYKLLFVGSDTAAGTTLSIRNVTTGSIGSSSGIAIPSFTDSTSPLYLGGNATGNFKGYFMESIAFAGSLTSFEETRLLNQLNHKWF